MAGRAFAGVGHAVLEPENGRIADRIGILRLGGGRSYKATGTCSISPSPVAVGEVYTVSVSGLSLDTPDYLFILPPNSAGYTGALSQEVFPDANGNWSGTFVADDPADVGKWTYEFDTVSSAGGTRLATKIAICWVFVQ